METEFILKDPENSYYQNNTQYPFQDEVYKIIGACMEVHTVLGRGFLEIVYKDALEYEFKLRGIPYEREKKLEIYYKDIKIKRDFFADFFVYNEIILEAKAQAGVVDELYKQTINYLSATRKELGLLVNFGEDSLVYKRVIHSNKRKQ